MPGFGSVTLRITMADWSLPSSRSMNAAAPPNTVAKSAPFTVTLTCPVRKLAGELDLEVEPRARQDLGAVDRIDGLGVSGCQRQVDERAASEQGA